jgi:glycoprotein endo-alpha-1,2-mannosidase
VRRLAPILAALAFLAVPTAAGAATGRAAIFYYPWYGRPGLDGDFAHWLQDGHLPPYDIASNFFPLRGAYSSADTRVVNAQMAEIRAAGVGTVIASWWGWGSAEDLRLPQVVEAAHAHHLAVAVQIEPYEGRSATTVLADVVHLRALGVSSFYVYRSDLVPPADWAAVNAKLTGVRMFAQTPLVGAAAAGGFAGVYTYDVLAFGGDKFARLCSQARAAHLLCAPSVGPGFDARRATGDPRVKPRNGGRTYDAMWRDAIRAHADLVTITSYNEWHEGTQIEPAQPRYGYDDYENAYGLTGARATRAYLDRTAYWTRALAGSR